jgi:hypothetical protein
MYLLAGEAMRILLVEDQTKSMNACRLCGNAEVRTLFLDSSALPPPVSLFPHPLRGTALCLRARGSDDETRAAGESMRS